MDEHNTSGTPQPETPGTTESGRPTHPLSPRARKILMVITGIMLIGLLAGSIVALNMLRKTDAPQSNESGSPAPTNQQSSFLAQYKETCKDREVDFTSAPMRMEDLGIIRPLGAMLDAHVTPTDHVYVGSSNQQAADNSYPVLMPANGTVVEVGAMPATYIGDRGGTMLAAEDHRLIISHSCRYFSIYIHVHKLSDALKAAIGSPLQPNENKRVSVELKAGDTVGYIGNSTFDWTPLDTSKTLTGYINPSRYKGETWKIHTVSPFDLYSGKLKTDLEAKSLRSIEPIGGKIDYDQPGKLVGNWFREGTNGYSGPEGSQRYWDGHLAIVPDYIDPTSTIVSTGNWGGGAKQFVVSGTVDPSTVTAGSGMIKYELKTFTYNTPDGSHWPGNTAVKGLTPSQDGTLVGTIGLQVINGEKLKVENFVGKSASQVTSFTSAAQTYER